MGAYLPCGVGIDRTTPPWPAERIRGGGSKRVHRSGNVESETNDAGECMGHEEDKDKIRYARWHLEENHEGVHEEVLYELVMGMYRLPYLEAAESAAQASILILPHLRPLKQQDTVAEESLAGPSPSDADVYRYATLKRSMKAIGPLLKAH